MDLSRSFRIVGAFFFRVDVFVSRLPLQAVLGYGMVGRLLALCDHGLDREIKLM